MLRWVFAFLMVGMCRAQDTRVVVEPTIPPPCTQLAAHLRAVDNDIASADEGKLDTERIQAALDSCKPGMAVELKVAGSNDAFLTGPLEMRAGVTLLIDKGVTLFGSRDPKVYEWKGPGVTPGLCGTIAPGTPSVFPAPQKPAPLRGGCRPLISILNAKDVGIMGDGVIDGRGYAQLIGKDYSWWQMARKAEPQNQRYFTPRMIVASHADGLVLYRITLHNSTNYHVSVNGTNGFTAWSVHLQTPTTRGMDARNTDGIDPGSSTNITIAHSWIDNGDDNIAISPYYTNQTTEGFEDPRYTGNRIPDYKAIALRNVEDTTSGDVLIAGIDDANRTEVTLDGVRVDGITSEQVHGRFATVTLGPGGTNLNFSKTEIKVVLSSEKSRKDGPSGCADKFVPMQ